MPHSATPEQPRRKIGRPALPFEFATEQVTVRVPRFALARLDAWRRGQGDLPTRPEGIRRLMELGLGRADHGAAA